jgi:heavy metal sensor kinase
MMQVEIPRRLLDDPEKRKFQEFSFAAKKYRIYTTFYPPEVNTNRQLIILQTLESMSEYQKDLERLRTLFYYITPLSTVLIILASWLIAHRTLKPIDILIKSVSDIDPLSLDQRVPVQTRDEVGQLGRSFNALLKRVDNAFQLLKRFTADASHELRTPLTSMRTRVELALNKTRDTEYYKSVLSEVLEDLHHLNKISDSLLFLSRGDARLIDTQFSSQDISDIVNDWIESISPLAEEKHITIEKNVEGGIKGSIDRTTFDSIVLNLLDNAIKYTNQNGNISIQLYLLGKSIHLTICNSGALISPADAEHIFERFVRLQQTRHSVRGTGLGLAIVKMAVQHHGGQIDVSVNDKNQNCFHVTIPDKSAN